MLVYCLEHSIVSIVTRFIIIIYYTILWWSNVLLLSLLCID